MTSKPRAVRRRIFATEKNQIATQTITKKRRHRTTRLPETDSYSLRIKIGDQSGKQEIKYAIELLELNKEAR
ncbi:hypothetical protein ACLIIZ_14325 [Azonexus caeni]|uniref:hypothetical protein n=1 Tax=Azonexus caeni TaxID=266126 RepID=UPI003A8A635E